MSNQYFLPDNNAIYWARLREIDSCLYFLSMEIFHEDISDITSRSEEYWVYHNVWKEIWILFRDAHE